MKECVRAWSWEKEDEIFFNLREKISLTEALGYPDIKQMPRIISLVGGGGTTTTMKCLSEELAEKGFRVLMTTTTHIGTPKEGQVCKAEHAKELLNVVWEENILTAGRSEETGDKLKMMEGLSDPEVLEKLLQQTDFILIEADGAKMLPLKIPADHEPVFLPQTGLVIACVGLSSVGKRFGETCFRFEQKGSWLMRQADDAVTPEDIALILMDQRGSRKNLDGRYYKIILNQADGEAERGYARKIIGALPMTLQQNVVVTHYKK